MDEFKFINDLASFFEKLPGVGKKTAARYAFSVVENLSNEEVERFASSLLETKNKVRKI